MNFMKTESLPYEYTEKDAQYKGIDMSQKHVVVDAQYIDTGQFTGNRFLEALPPITSDHSSINNLFTRIPSMPSWDALEKMDPILRDVVLDNIMDVRFPLPYHRQLKKELYRLICSSYRKREESTRYNEVQVQDKTYTTNTSLLAHPQGEAINGLAVIGPSGTGKSSSINLMLQHFPQVIIHNDGGRKIVQIVYLFVTCPELSNFNALYESIAKAVDDALNNGLELYKNQMKKIKGLGAKSLYVRQLIEGFGIGLIVLDEIQQIDLKSTKENSIEALLRLNNDTHVGFVVAGLPEAFRDLFHKPHTRGRFPYHLETGDYCNDLDQIRNIIEMLFVVFDFCNGAYQVDEEMVKIFFQESNGCVKFIDMMFECVVKDYLNRRKEDRPGVIDAAYVRTVAEKYDITIRAEMMKKITTDASDISWLNSLNTMDVDMDGITAAPEENAELRHSAINLLNSIYHSKYNINRIENAVDICIRKGFLDQSILIAKATEHLLNNKSDLRPRKPRKKVNAEASAELLKDILSE